MLPSRSRFALTQSLFLGWLVALPLVAGQITLRTDVECDTATARCEVTVTNQGSEPASELALEASSRSVIREVPGPEALQPGGVWSTGVDFSASQPGVGERSAMTLLVRYQDAGGYPSSAVSYGYFTGIDFAGTTVDARLSGASLAEGSQVLRLTIAPTPLRHEGTARLLLPDELRFASGPGTRSVTTRTGSATEVAFEVENASALAGGSYQVLALIETAGDGGAAALVVPATVSIGAPSTPLARMRPAAIPILVVLLPVYVLIRNLAPARAPAAAARHARWWPAFEVTVLTALVVYLVLLLQPGQLVSPTIATGGDTASHYLTAKVLLERLLPTAELLGWMPGNLAGYPTFQLYFPLPFLLMAALAPILGLPVAFKLGTVAGPVLLPLATYAALRCFGLTRPVPILGASLTLPFLLNETNSVWGGNLLSTLAGEFAYSFAFSLLVLFLGTSYRGLVRGRHLVLNAALLAAIGLSHAYALLLAGAVSASHLLWLPRTRAGAWYLARVYGLAFALVGFWILPLLAYAPYTTPYRDLWQVESWRPLVPTILWPLIAVIVVAAIRLLLRRNSPASAGNGSSVPVLAIGSLAWIGGAFYLFAPLLGVVDVRFLPATQLAICLLAAVGLAGLVRRLRARLAFTALIILAVVAWSERYVEAIPRWADWNYSGFQSKPLWGEFAQVNAHLSGDANDPRVAFEHSPFYNAVGSIRAFESLPLFSGRSTLEGLYIQSGIASPEIFYLQSEYSEVASCPFPDYHCARLDLDRAAEHMRLFNAGQLIARSPTVKAALARSEAFELERAVPPFEVHRVREFESSYVQPLALQPVVLESTDWKTDFFRWFKQPGTQPFLVRSSSRTADAARFPLRVNGLTEALPQVPLSAAEAVVADAILEDRRIRIHTNRPGHPLLLKVAYHPRWRPVRGTDAVHLASPGFIFVYPEESEVVLEFTATWLTRLGQLLSLVACAILLAVGVLALLRPPSLSSAVDDRPSISPARTSVGIGLVVALLLAAAGARSLGHGEAAVLYRRGLQAYKAESNTEAEALFRRAVEANPLSSAALHASFYRGLSLWRQERYGETIAAFEGMIDAYPESQYRAEAEYHVGLCHLRRGRTPEAQSAFAALVRAFPEDPWAERARQRLAELDSGDSRPTSEGSLEEALIEVSFATGTMQRDGP